MSLFHGYFDILIGLDAAVYSPAKYGILPELVDAQALVKANGWIEGSTILAILSGTLVGAWLAEYSDIGDEGLTIVVRKSERADSNRAVRRLLFEWTDDLRAVIDAARQLPRRIDSPYLFTTRRGKPYTTSGFDSIWQRVLSRAGVSGLHFHDLRARALTDANDQGGLDYAVKLAAHESASTTERYLRDRQAKRVRPVKRKF